MLHELYSEFPSLRRYITVDAFAQHGVPILEHDLRLAVVDQNEHLAFNISNLPRVVLVCELESKMANSRWAQW